MKVLYLYARRWWDTKMSIGRILYGEAVARHPDVELRFSGVGWPGWGDNASVTKNIADSMFVPDWIWVYKGEDYPTLRECPIPKLVTFNEANAQKTLAEIEAADATLVGFHHENDAPRWQHFGRRTFTLPHCCDVDELAGPLSERPIECLATGVRADRVYPLRGRMMDAIITGRLRGTVRKHPGYRLASNETIRQQHADYLAQLRSAKIALCCSSIHRYALAKYTEAAAAGCLVIGDMPDDSVFRDTLGKFIVDIPANSCAEEIADTVEYWLNRPDESQARVDAAKEVVRRNLTTRHYAERIVNGIKSARSD